MGVDLEEERDAWRVSAAVTMGRDRLSSVCVNLYSPLFSRSVRILLQLSGKLASRGNGGRLGRGGVGRGGGLESS